MIPVRKETRHERRASLRTGIMIFTPTENAAPTVGPELFERTDKLVEIFQQRLPVVSENGFEIGNPVFRRPGRVGRFRSGHFKVAGEFFRLFGLEIVVKSP